MPNQTIGYFTKIVSKSKRLNLKDKDILVKRLKRKKLKNIGRKYKVSYERIRQIERDALKKLENKIFQENLFEERV